MFLLSIKGNVSRLIKHGISKYYIVNALDIALRRVGVREIQIETDTVMFTNNETFMHSLQTYAGATSGKFFVSLDGANAKVYYDIYVRRLAIGAAPIILMFSLLISIQDNFDSIEKMLFAAFFFLWFFGVNYILILVRTRALLRRTLRKFAC